MDFLNCLCMQCTTITALNKDIAKRIVTYLSLLQCHLPSVHPAQQLEKIVGTALQVFTLRLQLLTIGQNLRSETQVGIHLNGLPAAHAMLIDPSAMTARPTQSLGAPACFFNKPIPLTSKILAITMPKLWIPGNIHVSLVTSTFVHASVTSFGTPKADNRALLQAFIWFDFIPHMLANTPVEGGRIAFGTVIAV